MFLAQVVFLPLLQTTVTSRDNQRAGITRNQVRPRRRREQPAPAAPLEADFLEPRNVGGRKGHQNPNELSRHPGANQARQKREGKALDEEQPDDASVTGAKCLAHGHLLPTRRASKQEQIADVETRREQQHRGGHSEKKECRPHFAEDQRWQRDSCRAQTAPLVRRLALKRCPELRRRLSSSGVRRQAAERHHFPSGKVRERHPQFRPSGELHSWGCNADDRNDA